ncbi:MAG TPA: hypothetical protein VFH54_12695 [Mycobacteriales bacterium]|nr:hypothetical protein [Mycobacteriales bacterium]
MAEATLDEMRERAHAVHINSRGHCTCCCPRCFDATSDKPCICADCRCEWAREANA